jgi:hypothetical protein
VWVILMRFLFIICDVSRRHIALIDDSSAYQYHTSLETLLCF